MKRWVAAAVAVGLMACGGAGSLPTGNDGGTDNPQTQDRPPEVKSLWPLTQGSHWKYQIVDETKGTFPKLVEVLGPAQVPDFGVSAMQVRSTQHLDAGDVIELSYQTEASGLVMRLREEDTRAGTLTSITTWGQGGTVKSLAAPQASGWAYSSTVQERVHLTDGSPDTVKEKTYAWRVVAVDEEVTVPAGRFKAIKIVRARTDADKVEKAYWLVPGIGKVKESGERDEELVEYQVAP